jgi:hypothetical protein
MEEAIIAAIQKYYPTGISSFDSQYDATKEYLALSELKNNVDARWKSFIDRMILKFGAEYVRDRSDNEPGNRCVIYIYQGDNLFEIVVHVSRIVRYYYYLIKKLTVDQAKVTTTQIDAVTNSMFSEIDTQVHAIIQTIEDIYNYSLMSQEAAETVLPNISTKNRNLGEATIFHAIFADAHI